MELFFGCFGNGVSVSDKSKNYENVAHISEHGVVKFYVEKNRIGKVDLDKILESAAQNKKSFFETWNKKNYMQKWEYMMDIPVIGFGWNAFQKVNYDNKDLPIEKRVELMEKVFFETHM